MKLFKLNPSGVFSEIAEAQIAKERTLQQIWQFTKCNTNINNKEGR
ncbi:MAG: hypothetical protein PHC50_08260 [Candidatus Cloacimonetes bacterium]|nr:hypothetical protein [Candidatus Cloacimonadota bacterium]